MFSLEAVIERLKQLPPAVLRSVDGIADMQAIMNSNRLPQITPAAHVVPAGLRAGARQDTAGGYVQPVVEVVGIVITIRGNNAQGKAALADLKAIILPVMDHLIGWSPEGFDQMEFSSGTTVRLDAEGLVYLLEFTIPTHLRADT